MSRRFWLASALTLVCLIVLGVSAQTGTKDKDKGTKVQKDEGKEKEKEKDKDKGKEKDKDKDKGKEKDKDKGKEKEKEADKGQGETVELTLKAFEEKGKAFVQKLETKTNQKMTVSGMNNVQNQEQTFWFEWIPEGKKDGKYVVKQKILGLKMDIDIGGNKISFESGDKDQKKNPMTQFFKALEKAEFTLTIDPESMTVKEVKGVKELVDSLSSVNAAMKPLLEKILSEDAIKQMASPVLGVVPPNGKVPKSKEWGGKDKKMTLDMGPIGSYEVINTYRLKEATKKIADITVEIDLKYLPPAEGGKQLPFTIEKTGTKLESKEKSGGDIQFDLVKGRIKSSKLKVVLKGTLKINIAGTVVSVDLDQTQDVVLQTYDVTDDSLPAFVKEKLKEKKEEK